MGRIVAFAYPGGKISSEIKKIVRESGYRMACTQNPGINSDKEDIFDRQIKFIQEIGVVTAMVGVLTALPQTRLWHRLKSEGRLVEDSSGENTDGTVNFVPKMGTEKLVEGYKKILATIYSPKNYYNRVITFLKAYNPEPLKKKIHFNFTYLSAFMKSIWLLGIQGKERLHYWKLIVWTLLKRPRFLNTAVTLAIYGFHFRKIIEV